MKRYVLSGILLAFFMLACLVATAEAAPAAPVDLTLSQPDGSTFIARQWGDEWQNGYETNQGFTILQLDDGWWVYAGMADGKSVLPALENDHYLVVGQASPQGLTPHLRPKAILTTNSTATLSVSQEPRTPNTGTQSVLVLLASFSDRAETYTATSFASSMFGASSSVKDFYQDASFGLLTLAAATETHGTTNDGVVGWLNLGYNHPNTGSTIDTRNFNIVKNALIAADSYVNYASYDLNSDGYISTNELHIVVVVAGYEEAYGGASPSVWAHQWYLDAVTPPSLDGKILGESSHGGGYSQFGEIHYDHKATIGIMVHELGHSLSWPDLYDIDNSSEGVGEWSIMGSGNWNSVSVLGDSPALPDAWLKWYQGWITPTVVSGTLTGASIQQAETNAKAYLLRPNPGGIDWNFEIVSGSGEFFLVENRQLTGYDAGLPGCGLLIWHIDESVTSTNSANANEYHPLVKLIEADGLNDLVNGSDRGDTGDPYPGSTSNYNFTYNTVPNSRLYSGVDSLVTVTNVSSTCAATMTANLAYTGSFVTFAQYLPVVMGGLGSNILWNQVVSSVNSNAYVNQDFLDLPTYSTFLADDFLVGSSGWSVKEIYVPGNIWNGATSLSLATQLVFQIYADNAGVPAGNPISGGAYWSLSLPPTDSRISLTNGVGGLPSNVRLVLTSTVHLPAGRYWLVFYPVMSFATGGQYGRHVSDTLNGLDGMAINPGGGMGLPASWTSIQDASTWGMVQQDLAFQIKGY